MHKHYTNLILDENNEILAAHSAFEFFLTGHINEFNK